MFWMAVKILFKGGMLGRVQCCKMPTYRLNKNVTISKLQRFESGCSVEAKVALCNYFYKTLLLAHLLLQDDLLPF